MRRDSTLATIMTALVLCIVCSVIVSASAVGLRSLQDENKRKFRQKNILEAAGYSAEQIQREGVTKLFENIETRLINFQTGDPAEKIDAGNFDQRVAAKDPTFTNSIAIPADKQTFGFSQHERYGRVYLMKQDGELKKVILPIYGKGLWSTLYGFISLESDLNTVSGITFYEHKETPGLGGEVDNPDWKALWVNKHVQNSDGEVKLEIVKGKVVQGSTDADHQIDGLSGATITSQGVSNAVRYWLNDGYRPFLDKLGSEPHG
ncbi:MAG: Na(+)-translocating NADH-quinone reductase subunit C [Planctomycetaceae bacterium]|nr:Na(+)-translocating NADH-quinone reductase subunit C [Planctomycetaceae bacterium]